MDVLSGFGLKLGCFFGALLAFGLLVSCDYLGLSLSALI